MMGCGMEASTLLIRGTLGGEEATKINAFCLKVHLSFKVNLLMYKAHTTGITMNMIRQSHREICIF